MRATPTRHGGRLSAALLALALLGCAHGPGRPALTPDRAERRLLVLEREFAEFTGESLVASPEGLQLEPEEALAELDKRIAELEGLRLRYLDLLGEGATDRQRVVAMVRIAELHLDLGARVRRLPYPADLPAGERPAFDERLSRMALPLEAVGLGVLRQVLDYAERRSVDGRFVRRARLYLALHDEGVSLTRADLEALRRELKAVTAYAAPRRLLEVGRVGQRASR